jgi:hypothetical protein
VLVNDFWQLNNNQWTKLLPQINMVLSGSYGAQGVESQTNYPGARYMSATYYDTVNHQLLLFGGFGYGNSVEQQGGR